MPSQREIARHLGFTQPRVCQLVKEGLPTNSFEAAEEWLNGRWYRRAPTNGNRINWEISHSKARRRVRRVPLTTGNSLQDALASAIMVNEEAFNLFEEAQASGQDGRLGPYIQLFAKSLELRMKAERMVRLELERRTILVPKQEMIELGRRTIGAVVRRLKRLPDESGPQCNPLDPLRAAAVLQRAVNEILLVGQKAIQDLSSHGERV